MNERDNKRNDEYEIYKKRNDGKEVDVKESYSNGFRVTSVFPKMSGTEAREQQAEITEGIVKLMEKSKKTSSTPPLKRIINKPTYVVNTTPYPKSKIV